MVQLHQNFLNIPKIVLCHSHFEESQRTPGLHQAERCQHVRGDGLQVSCPVLGSSVQETQVHTGEGTAKYWSARLQRSASEGTPVSRTGGCAGSCVGIYHFWG